MKVAKFLFLYAKIHLIIIWAGQNTPFIVVELILIFIIVSLYCLSKADVKELFSNSEPSGLF